MNSMKNYRQDEIHIIYAIHIIYVIHIIYEIHIIIFKLVGPCEILSHGQKASIAFLVGRTRTMAFKTRKVSGECVVVVIAGRHGGLSVSGSFQASSKPCFARTAVGMPDCCCYCSSPG